MRRDVDRTMLPGGSVWNLVDFIPDEIQAAASGRGGWTYAGPAMTSAVNGIMVGYHPDLAKVVATDGLNGIWNAVAGGASLGTFKGQGGLVYHRGLLFSGSWPSGGIGQQPYYLKDDGTTAQFSGAPIGIYPAVYKDHAILARQFVSGSRHGSTQNIQRIWFSAAGDPTTWDTNFGWWDTTGAITGIATLTNAILVFHADSTERLRGTTPPPGSDMVLEPFLPNAGCIDNSSIAYWQENAIWASSNGVYMSNGVSTVDLTLSAEMKTYWQTLIAQSPSKISGGIYRDHYIVSVNTGSANIDTLCVDLTNRTMWRLTNICGTSFVNVQAGNQEKLYMGQLNAPRVIELSSLWSPGSTVKRDGDNTVPLPIIETGAFRGWDRLHRRWIQSMGKQNWRFVNVDYDLRDAASDNPTITLSYALSPGGAYTTVTGGTLPETTDYTRKRRSIGAVIGAGKRSNMIEFKLAVNGPYASANLYTLEGDFAPIDIGRL